MCSGCYKRHRPSFDEPLLRPSQSLIAEVDLILAGRGPQATAQAVGKTAEAISRAAYREGRIDIARAFKSEVYRERMQRDQRLGRKRQRKAKSRR